MTGRPRRRGAWVPPQHGAWAMLLVPFAAALLPAWGGRAVPWHLPLLVAWLSGYLLSYPALRALRTGRPGRVLPQLLVYGAVTAAAAVPLLLARPALLLLAPAFAVLLGLSALAARAGRERSLGAGLVAVAEACLVVPAVALVARVPVAPVLGTAAASALYFAGTVLHVKTMIRERGSRGYRVASVAYHLAALPLAALLSPWLAVPFALYALRAAALGGRRLPVRTVGLVEVAASAALLAALVPGP